MSLQDDIFDLEAAIKGDKYADQCLVRILQALNEYEADAEELASMVRAQNTLIRHLFKQIDDADMDEDSAIAVIKHFFTGE